MAKVKIRGIACAVGGKTFKPGADGLVDCSPEDAVLLVQAGGVEVKQAVVASKAIASAPIASKAGKADLASMTFQQLKALAASLGRKGSRTDTRDSLIASLSE